MEPPVLFEINRKEIPGVDREDGNELRQFVRKGKRKGRRQNKLNQGQQAIADHHRPADDPHAQYFLVSFERLVFHRHESVPSRTI